MNHYQLEYESGKLYKTLLPWFESTKYWPPLAGDFAWMSCWLEMAGNLDPEFRDTFNRLPLAEFTRENNKRVFADITPQTFQRDSVLFRTNYQQLFWVDDWYWIHRYCIAFFENFPRYHITSHAIQHWIAFQNNGAGLEGDYTNYVKLPSWSNHLPTNFGMLISGIPSTIQHAYFMDFA